MPTRNVNRKGSRERKATFEICIILKLIPSNLDSLGRLKKEFLNKFGASLTSATAVMANGPDPVSLGPETTNNYFVSGNRSRDEADVPAGYRLPYSINVAAR